MAILAPGAPKDLRLDERAAAELVVGLLQLFLRVHDDRPIPGDGLLERLARHEQETHPFIARLNDDFVAPIEKDQRTVLRIAAYPARRVACGNVGRSAAFGDVVGPYPARLGRVTEGPRTGEDICEGVARSLDRQALALTGRHKEIEISWIGGHAGHRTRLPPERAADHSNTRAIVVGDHGYVARRDI